MCSCDWLERPEVWGRVERTAKKEHKCCECGSVIGKGEKYIYSSGLWDGKWGNFKTCLICDAIAQKLECFEMGAMYRELKDCDYLDYARDDDGEFISPTVWVSNCDWLEVVSQKPLKCKVVSELPTLP